MSSNIVAYWDASIYKNKDIKYITVISANELKRLGQVGGENVNDNT